jgi:superfamily II DNA or RNA helicase
METDKAMAALTLNRWKSTGQKLQLVWGESRLLIAPAIKELLPELRIQEKVMVPVPGSKWKKKTEKVTRNLYDLVMRDDFAWPVCNTMHGLIDDVCGWLHAHGVEYVVHDTRLDMPEPSLDMMHGFRFSQRELLETALKQNKSGLIGAPTRFGKSTLLKNICRAYSSLTTVVVIPGNDLLQQTYDDLKEALPHREVKKIPSARVQSREVTVCSMDSLHLCDPGITRLVIVDEPHALPTDDRVPEFQRFDKSRIIGLGATLEGRFDNRDLMIKGLIGPVLAERTYLEAVAEGAIAPIVVYMIVIQLEPFAAFNRSKAYEKVLWQSTRVGDIVRWLCLPGQVFPPDWQILGFINNEDQANFVSGHAMSDIPHDIAMAKLMTKSERKNQMETLKTGETRLCFATRIYAQGVTFSNLRVVLNLEGGGASTQTIQKPGRVAELIQGKRCGIYVDFLFTATPEAMKTPGDWRLPIYESKARLNYYQQKGFEVYCMTTPRELATHVMQRCV